MVKKVFIFIILIFILSSCYMPNVTEIVPTITFMPTITLTPSYTPFPALTNTPFPTSIVITPPPVITRTPFPTFVPNVGVYQGIGAREVECGDIFLPEGTTFARCYNISGIGAARVYFDSNNELIVMAVLYKFGQGYDAGIFATNTAFIYGWDVNDLIELISMMNDTGILYMYDSLKGISEISEDNTTVYMLISPDANYLLSGINLN